jgi:hypothetical protein
LLPFFKYWVGQGKEDPSTCLWWNWPKQSKVMTDQMRTEDWTMLNDHVFLSHLLQSEVFKDVQGPELDLGQSCNGGYLHYRMGYTFSVPGKHKRGEIVIQQTVVNRVGGKFEPDTVPELTVRVETECSICGEYDNTSTECSKCGKSCCFRDFCDTCGMCLSSVCCPRNCNFPPCNGCQEKVFGSACSYCWKYYCLDCACKCRSVTPRENEQQQ